MSLTYGQYVSQLSNLMGVSSADTNFETFLPGCIDYAEQRIYRELSLLATRVSDTSTLVSTASRSVAVSTASGSFVVMEALNVLTPAGAQSSGTRNPLDMVSRQAIDNFYPGFNTTYSGLPIECAMLDQNTLLLGPAPDRPYYIEVLGTIRPTPLSSGNPNTFLSDRLPDLFMAGSMVFASKYMRDWGNNTGDSVMAWGTEYDKLKMSADTEEACKQYRSQGWTSAQPRQVTTPPRQ